MSYRQVTWELSNGVLVLAVAGGFWIGLIGSILHRPDIVAPVGIIGIAPLLWGFVRLRRKSAGFTLREMKSGTEEQQESLRQISRGMNRAMLLETLLFGVAVGSVEYLHRVDLLWPALGIAVSLHFIPLGRLFRVRSYYFAGIAGAAVCLIGIVALKSPNRVLFAGTGMCLNMWGTAAWLLVRSDQIAARSLRDSSTALTA